MNQNKKSKKADTSSKTIIAWVILIITFAIIFIFLTVFPWGNEITRDSCHTTIVLRASATLGKLSGLQEDIPLKCQTQRVCLKNGLFGNCPIFGKTSYTKISASTKEEVVDSIAETMYADFSMTGKGLLNFMPKKLGSKTYCLITSKIAVDPKTKVEVTNFDIYQRLAQRKNEEGVSNLQEFYNLNTPNLIQEIQVSIAAKDERFKDNVNFLETKVDLSKVQDVVVVITPDGWWKSITGGVLVAGAIALTPLSWGSSLVLIGVAAPTTTYLLGPSQSNPSEYHPPILIEDSPEQLNKLGCSSIETLA